MDKQNVIFLCTGNSARSQMAEGFVRALAGERFEAFSAGLEPRDLNQLAVRVMAEKGIDISDHESKSVDLYLGKRNFHHAIFVCRDAEKNCPTAYPFALRRYSWPLEDPAEATGDEKERLKAFRRVRDALELKIKGWLDEVSRESEA